MTLNARRTPRSIIPRTKPHNAGIAAPGPFSEDAYELNRAIEGLAPRYPRHLHVAERRIRGDGNRRTAVAAGWEPSSPASTGERSSDAAR